MCHGDEGVVQSLHGRDPLVRVQRQHLLQQVYELPPVGLLSQDVRPLQVGHVHLRRDRKSLFVDLERLKGPRTAILKSPTSPASYHPDS